MNAVTKELQTRLDDLWTMVDVCKVLRKTPMTIHNWRREKNLPAIEVPGNRRPAIRFSPDDVIRWAKLNNIEVFPLVKRPRRRRRDLQ